MKRLLGWVLVIVVGVLAWTWLTDGSASRCEASATVAHADDDSCPGYLADAVNDPGWATGQQAEIRDQRVATGRYMTSSSETVHTITSGTDSLSELADGYLQDSDDFDYPGRGTPTVVADVETKLAAAMRRDGAPIAVMAINHPNVCDGAMSCRQAVPAILPEGAVLYVWELEADTPVRLTGKASS